MTDRTTMLPNNSDTRSGRSSLAKAALILLVILVAGPLADERASAVILQAFNVTSLTTQSDSNTYGGLGYVFTTSRTLTITAFGLFDHNGNTIPGTDVPIGLYYSNNLANNGAPWSGGGGHTSGELLLSSAVSSADPIYSLSGDTYTSGDGFRYRNLASNLILPAGTYEIVYRDAADVPPWASGATFTTAPGVTGLNESVYNASAGSPGTTLYAFNSVFTAGAYFGPNLEIAPEPASAGLLIAGGILLLRRRRA